MRAQDDQRASVYLQRAGENALRRWAYTEAIAHLRRGLEVLQRWPESTARVQNELEIQLLLAQALRATRGFAAPAVGQAYDGDIRISVRDAELVASTNRVRCRRG